LTPYWACNGTTGFAYIADNTALSITANLTYGAWFYSTNGNVSQGVMGKWAAGNTISYVMYYNYDPPLFFRALTSTDGTLGASKYDICTIALPTANVWHFAAVVFTPNANLRFFVDGTWYTGAGTALPSIFNGTQNFELARINATAYLGGGLAQAFICAYSVPEAMIDWLWRVQAPLFGRQV
jgi:hypothetical protein